MRDAMDDATFREVLRSHSAGDSVGFLLWHATLRWQRTVAEVLSDLDLTYPQFGMLGTTWWLGRDGEQPNQRQVAEHSGMGEVMTSQLVRTLERKGLLTRVRSTKDVRARCLALTDTGQALTERALVAIDQAELDFFGEVEDQKGMLAALRTLAGRDRVGGPASADAAPSDATAVAGLLTAPTPKRTS